MMFYYVQEGSEKVTKTFVSAYDLRRAGMSICLNL